MALFRVRCVPGVCRCIQVSIGILLYFLVAENTIKSMKSSSVPQRKRGRPPGPPKVDLHLRILPQILRDLEFLSSVLDGNPSPNKLALQAVRDYVAKKLEEPRIRAEYEAHFTGPVRVLRSGVQSDR